MAPSWHLWWFRFAEPGPRGPELEVIPEGYERRADGWHCAPGYAGEAKALGLGGEVLAMTQKITKSVV